MAQFELAVLSRSSSARLRVLGLASSHSSASSWTCRRPGLRCRVGSARIAIGLMFAVAQLAKEGGQCCLQAALHFDFGACSFHQPVNRYPRSRPKNLTQWVRLHPMVCVHTCVHTHLCMSTPSQRRRVAARRRLKALRLSPRRRPRRCRRSVPARRLPPSCCGERAVTRRRGIAPATDRSAPGVRPPDR